MNFNSKRFSKTASITLHGKPDKVFPLFGPVEEKKWAEGWNPEIIYSKSSLLEEHMVFKTSPHFQGEGDYTWTVSKYIPSAKLIEYTVSTPQRIWFITIQCADHGNGTTDAQITYTFTGMSENGNDQNKKALARMYHADLKDWEEAINYYLKTGKMMRHK
jgi:hypothetical protein